MQFVTLLDVETTGLNAESDEVVEVGAILYSVEHRAAVQQVSTLLPAAANPAEPINHISSDLLSKLQQEWVALEAAWKLVNALRQWDEISGCIVAHHCDFDRAFVEKRLHLELSAQWVDSQDIPFPNKRKAHESLITLCVNHGVPVVSAHRALDDCRLLADLLTTQESLAELLDIAAQPKATVIAQVGYEERQLAKDAGFCWDGTFKHWTRKMRLTEVGNLPFSVQILDEF